MWSGTRTNQVAGLGASGRLDSTHASRIPFLFRSKMFKWLCPGVAILWMVVEGNYPRSEKIGREPYMWRLPGLWGERTRQTLRRIGECGGQNKEGPDCCGRRLPLSWVMALWGWFHYSFLFWVCSKFFHDKTFFKKTKGKKYTSFDAVQVGKEKGVLRSCSRTSSSYVRKSDQPHRELMHADRVKVQRAYS